MEPEYRQAMPWRQRDRKLEGFVREVIGIRRKWILPEDGYVRREDGRYPELLTAERTGSGGNIRFWLNLGEDAELPEEIGHAEILLAEGQKERILFRGGYLIVRMEKTEKERVHDGG